MVRVSIYSLLTATCSHPNLLFHVVVSFVAEVIRSAVLTEFCVFLFNFIIGNCSKMRDMNDKEVRAICLVAIE